MPKILRGGEENSKLEFRTYWGPLGAVGARISPVRPDPRRTGPGSAIPPSPAEPERSERRGPDRIPKTLAFRLQSIQTRFFWHGHGKERGWLDISWGRICLPKEAKELAIRDITTFNMVALCKWWWRIGAEEGGWGLWHDIIQPRYLGSSSGWDLGSTPQYRCSPVWKGFLQSLDFIKASVSISLGDGQRCSFWTNRWCGNLTLDHLFPDLFAISSAPMATVADFYEENHAGGMWVPTFRRNLSMEETTHLLEMFALLAHFRLTANMVDWWTWRWEKSRCFSVKSAYLMLINGSCQPVISYPGFSLIAQLYAVFVVMRRRAWTIF
ncbi:hypothetical protein Taro_019663 [Colocasia esculenta]|uniref:Uncharacterized protein n=1 Tax=Colocasia esculenta TaxID=4460 RepID=A0A843UZZ5_COLES|nr:hypothetical protein [Colocasia esculenta]